MTQNIKKKDTYKGLVESEHKRQDKEILIAFKDAAILIIKFLIIVAICVLIIVNTGEWVRELDIALNADMIEFIGCLCILGTGVTPIVFIFFDDYKTRVMDKQLDKLYQYLPIDTEDIKNNNLNTWESYILCIHNLALDVMKMTYKDSVCFHERVRNDILNILVREYNISDELKEQINNNFEAFVLKCSSEEQITQLSEYYINKNKLKLMEKELEEKYKSVIA